MVWNRRERMKDLLGARSLTSQTRESELEKSTSEDITSAFSKIVAPGRNKAGLLATGSSSFGQHTDAGSSSSSRRDGAGAGDATVLSAGGQMVTVTNNTTDKQRRQRGGAVQVEEEQVFIPYRTSDADEDRGYAINDAKGTFEMQAGQASFAVDGDDAQDLGKTRQRKKWCVCVCLKASSFLLTFVVVVVVVVVLVVVVLVFVVLVFVVLVFVLLLLLLLLLVGMVLSTSASAMLLTIGALLWCACCVAYVCAGIARRRSMLERATM